MLFDALDGAREPRMLAAGAHLAIERIDGRWRATLRLGAIRLCALGRVADALSPRRAARRQEAVPAG